MPNVARISWLVGGLAWALLPLAGLPALAAGPETDLARRLEAVVRVQAESQAWNQLDPAAKDLIRTFWDSEATAVASTH